MNHLFVSYDQNINDVPTATINTDNHEADVFVVAKPTPQQTHQHHDCVCEDNPNVLFRFQLMFNANPTLKHPTVFLLNENFTDLLFIENVLTTYHANLEILGKSQTIEDGLLQLKKNKPDILFLDVKFQEQIIFAYLDLIDLNGTQIIISSPEHLYAVDAFAINATDFILKPFTHSNILLAIDKCFKGINLNYRLSTLENSNIGFNDTNFSNDYITIHSLHRVDFLKMSDIVYCKSDGKYTTFYLHNEKQVLSSKNIGAYEKLLKNNFFYRIHHSYIINIQYLSGIINDNGHYCELINSTLLPIAKRKKDSFNAFLKQKF